ncbi:uncharacterized protein L3040_007607 [Drepanopeziza brunnea f. sp. 'multigermtubi']|uniref:Uncharacterized protein n=1 Tax=Marssonina brunnea f. sp. multigermtubi (strain MB_m1) TaxID=1072389 RepID=K1XBW5_MARBU|nr:uncharacterized protein MBM_03995 [Drepanopeziza brunnea f. sp. 'multigermtubi' MB_m1]EKD18223.1 hypothetical protein MBM_03995 [Drepanopeziza brunnea f. sp. 'multigermtubi' MB_m1]KAJ5037432.1 hypothetical protein L3040_007607 [Drepanopeziza brunnea f. sp. 'multigermtubi']
MSSSPPETPSKPRPANKARALMAAGPSKGVHQAAMKPPELEVREAAGAIAQVLSSTPPKPEPTSTASKDNNPVGMNGRAERECGNHEHEHEHEESSHTDETELIEENINGELEKLDWFEFEKRYATEIRQLDDDEEATMEKVDKLADAFYLWGRAGSYRDNERISKRLKTRIRFTEIAESSLEEKKNHYVQVVDAFQNAMKLLRGQR